MMPLAPTRDAALPVAAPIAAMPVAMAPRGALPSLG
jgi:hypothetical protein